MFWVMLIAPWYVNTLGAKHFADKKAPIEEGSQTDHSAMMSTVSKVVSL